jgi:hypothetical protein
VFCYLEWYNLKKIKWKNFVFDKNVVYIKISFLLLSCFDVHYECIMQVPAILVSKCEKSHFRVYVKLISNDASLLEGIFKFSFLNKPMLGVSGLTKPVC